MLGKEAVGVLLSSLSAEYAVKLVFDDGHDTASTPGNACTSWVSMLQEKWARYLVVKAAGK